MPSFILQFRITHGFVIRNELLITRIYERVKYRQLFYTVFKARRRIVLHRFLKVTLPTLDISRGIFLTSFYVPFCQRL